MRHTFEVASIYDSVRESSMQGKACPQCKNMNPLAAAFCQVCGRPFQGVPTVQTGRTLYAVDPYAGQVPAIASLVLSILGAISCTSIGFLMASSTKNGSFAMVLVLALTITGLVLGIKSSRTNYRTLALSGIIVSCVVLGIFALACIWLLFGSITNGEPKPATSTQPSSYGGYGQDSRSNFAPPDNPNLPQRGANDIPYPSNGN
jgi:hypothetical protein